MIGPTANWDIPFRYTSCRAVVCRTMEDCAVVLSSWCTAGSQTRHPPGDTARGQLGGRYLCAVLPGRPQGQGGDAMSRINGQLPAEGRVRGFLREHGVRLVAGLVLLVGGIFIGLGAHSHLFLWLVLLGPLLVGACVPLLSMRSLTDRINGWGGFFSAGVDKVRGRETKLAQYIQRPFYGGGSGIWRISEPVPSQHLKAGLRLAAFAYLLAIMGFALYVAVYVMLVIVAIFLVLLVIFWVASNGEEEKSATTGHSQLRERDPDVMVPVKGAFYRGTNWFNEELAGRVDAEGNIYKGTNWLNEEKIGRVDADGNVYRGTNCLTEEKVGRIDGDGRLYKGSNWFTEERVGRVEEGGTVQKGTHWLDEEKVGRVDKD